MQSQPHLCPAINTDFGRGFEEILHFGRKNELLYLIRSYKWTNTRKMSRAECPKESRGKYGLFFLSTEDLHILKKGFSSNKT